MSTFVAVPPDTNSLLAQYEPGRDAFDELVAKDGKVRPHFTPLLRDLDALGPAELKRRAETARRRSEEHTSELQSQ